jgi:C-terminal processing protease CtpA/Prc
MVSCNTELSYKLTVLGLIGEIHDTHANIWQQDKTLNQFFGNNTAPLEIRFIENKAVVFKTFKQLNSNSQIKSGDIVTQINGIETDKIVSEKIKSCPASNYPTKLRDVSKRILRTNDETISLTLENQAGSFSETIHTVPVTDINFYKNDVPSHSETIKDIGYIYPATLKKGEIDEIMKSYLDKKGIIIDLRCYPSDFIVFSLGKYLMPEPTEFVKFTTTSASNPGLFTFGETLKVGEKNRQYFKGKVILLVDERTQSNAEYTTMALRVAPKATVIGSTTAGADGNVSTIVIPGNIRTMISGIGVYYPDGRETQRVGIVPDLEIKPTVEGIRVGKDEVLEKAIELINK